MASDETVNWRSSIPFLGLHLVPLAAIWTGVTAGDLWLCAALYAVRMFFVTAGYHRYFAHRSYKTSRGLQFVMALGGATAAQKGPLWWAGNHRRHHQFADTERDPHSPRRGFWWSHIGWILCDKYSATDTDAIRDFARYPELRWLDRHDWVAPWALAVACFLAGGWSALVVGFFLSTILLWHATFTVNSLAHLIGRRRFDTPDTSRNSWVVALVTGGEGWHNNHHHYQSCARQGFRWWEVDMSYYAIRALAAVGVVWDVREPTERALAAKRIEGEEAKTE